MSHRWSALIGRGLAIQCDIQRDLWCPSGVPLVTSLSMVEKFELKFRTSPITRTCPISIIPCRRLYHRAEF